MIINNNPMNPVPLWPSKNNWYCKKATNHGACAHPVLPTGCLPAMMLTIPRQGMEPSRQVHMTAMLGVSEGGISHEIGRYDDSVTVTPNNGTHAIIDEYTIIITPSRKSTYSISVNPRGSSIPMLCDGSPDVSSSALSETVSLTSKEDMSGVIYHLIVQINMAVTYEFRWRIYKIGDDTPIFSYNYSELVEPVPSNVRTNQRYSTINIDEKTLTGDFNDGVYYCTVKDEDGVTHYTEPFMWLTNLERHLLVTYRRSKPIVIGDNYFSFDTEDATKSLFIYLPGKLIMPPFKFDVDVEEIDGMKYARKQVSYTQEHVDFHCTSYFAQAIRLLWHCDIRYAGLMRIDYMEPPQVDWKDDNHLCDVVLEFQCDTVMQTNGTASAYNDSSDIGHASYDISFDQSFS